MMRLPRSWRPSTASNFNPTGGRPVPGRQMNCREVARVLQVYLDGDLDQLPAARLVAHLEECRRCGLEAATYARIKDALADRRQPVPADALERLRMFGERLARGEEPSGPASP